MAAVRLTLDTDHIVQAYRAGRTAEDIAAELGVSANTVLRRLNGAGVEMRPSGTPRVAIDEVDAIAVYDSGVGLKSVAARFGVSDTALRSIFQNRGVHLRNRREQQQLRMDNTSRTERMRLVVAAHEAARGRTRSLAERCLSAKTREQRQTHISKHERRLAAMMRERGIKSRHQTAVGPYNCDLTVDTVAVEVFGGYWHWTPEKSAHTAKRFRYLMDRGWDIVAVPVNMSWPLTAKVADHIARHINRIRRNPSAVREYRVIWGAGEFEASGCLDDDYITIKPPFTNARDPVSGRYIRVAREAVHV